MKKLLAAMLAVLLLACLSACGGSNEPAATPATVKPVVTTPDITASTSPDVGGLADTPAKTEELKGKVVNASSGVNVRAEPNTEAAILTTADTGAEFIVVETGDWYKIALPNGTLGYIHGDYMEMID